jgi:hypothetical protein
MTNEQKIARLLACASMAALVACGGGSGGPDLPPVPAPPPPPTGEVPPPPPPPVGEVPPPVVEPPVPTPAPPPPSPPPQPQAGNPILFVTQVPVSGDTFMKITSTFGHHLPRVESVPRGGDLWIAYRDTGGAPELRNLTAAAGFGVQANGQPLDGQSGPNAIAVRDPSVHPSGARALVSMVVGTDASARWQIYEVTGLRRGETVQFRRLPQPASYNNISPVYGTDGQVIFTSDIPRAGPEAQFAHLRQLDEYEEEPTVTGLWRLASDGSVRLLHHAPSGAFRPSVDSFGRVIFTNWDHLQRDQQAGDPVQYGLFNFRDEGVNAVREPINGDAATTLIRETFPEPRLETELAPGHKIHRFNMFLPWMLNQDGTGAETLNHVGRHELGIFGEATIPNAGLSDIVVAGVNTPLVNTGLKFETAHFIRENPLVPGDYYAVAAPEFGTQGGGMIYRIQGGPAVKPHNMQITLVTGTNTAGTGGPAVYRSPVPLRDGSLLASASFRTHLAQVGSAPYEYRLHKLKGTGALMEADATTHFTAGIAKRLQAGAEPVTLWEWDAAEVPQQGLAAPPATVQAVLEAPESQAFAEAGVSPQALRQFMQANKLALIVSRDVTSRDGFDRTQPFNLRVTGTTKQSVRTGSSAPVFDIDHMQLFQADQLRGFMDDASRGRRVMPMPMTAAAVGTTAMNPAAPGAPAGSVKIGADGSMAAFVPADRAMTWQLVKAGQGDPRSGTDGVVRERFWLSFRPGEVRVCASCHGHSDKDQMGHTEPTNKPQALVDLLRHFRSQFPLQ